MNGMDAGRAGCPSPTPASGIGGMAEGQSAQPTERSEFRRARPAKRGMPKDAFRNRAKIALDAPRSDERAFGPEKVGEGVKTPVIGIYGAGRAMRRKGRLSVL